LPEIAPTSEIPTETPTPVEPAKPETDVSGSVGGVVAFYSNRDGNSEIYLINTDGSNLLRLTNNSAEDMAPAISPDGQSIVFTSNRDGNNEIYVMNVDGSDQNRLTENGVYESHSAWSPDSEQIAFISERDGNWEIYIMNADGSNPRRLTDNPADDMRPAWSPNGEQIVFNSERDGNWEIYVVDIDGSNLQRLTNSHNGETFPVWSPDGMRIAYRYGAPRDWNGDIWVMDIDGSNPRQLTHEPSNDENPFWSPDGKRIVFQSDRYADPSTRGSSPYNFELLVMDADGGNIQRLTNDLGGDYWPSWGPAASHKSSNPTTVVFEKSTQIFESIPTWKIGLADLDNDGDLDAAFANCLTNDSQIWLNDGNGNFTDTGQQLMKFGHGVDVGDVDGDGDPDVIITSHTLAPTRVYLNDGNAIFQELVGAFASTVGHRLDLFDLDGDGDLDVVGEGRGRVSLYWNDGSGIFTKGELTFKMTTAWGDLDADGDVDLLIKENGVGYSVHLNDGTGNFFPFWTHADPEAMDIGDIALGDADNDGDLDAIITNGHHQSTSYPVMVFLNDGTGQFTDSGQRLSAVTNAGISLGDLDNDGDLDLVLNDYLEPSQIWLNDGAGQFTDSGFQFGDDQFYRHAHLGDLDGDGDLDIFLATFGLDQGPNEIWFNLGN
jgi:Tol biopolymer transport system component